MHRHMTTYFKLLSDIVKLQPLLLSISRLSLAYLPLGLQLLGQFGLHVKLDGSQGQ
jgi:hypothetical protein